MRDKRREKFERRVIKDRRKKRFGRRGPKWLIDLANWLVTSPNLFFAYILFSLLGIIYSVANLAYNINQLIIDYIEKFILH